MERAAGTITSTSRVHAVIALAACLVAPGTGQGQCVEYGGHIQFVGVARWFGDHLDVAIANGTAWIADGFDGLQGVDISDPAAPVLVGHVGLNAQAVAVAGNYLYVATGNALVVVDIADPDSPTVVESLALASFPSAVAVHGSLACVTQGTEGVILVNITNPLNITLVRTVDTPTQARGVTISSSGEYAYVADHTSGIMVIDVSPPSLASLVGSRDTLGEAQGVAVSGSVLLVADGAAGLRVLDVSNPTVPVPVGALAATDYEVSDVAFHGARALVLEAWALRCVDLSVLASPVETGRIRMANARSFAVLGDHAYVMDGSTSMQIVNVASPTSVPLLSVTDTPGYSYDVVVSGGRAYVTDGASGLQILDVANPTAPLILGAANTPGHAYEVALAGDFAYVADGTGLQVVNVAVPQSPGIVGSTPTPGSVAKDIALAGNFAYIADFDAGLCIVNIATPQSPTVVRNVALPLFVEAVTIHGQHAYVAVRTEGLRVIDIATPGQEAVVGSVQTAGSAFGIAIEGNYAYIAEGYDFVGVQVVDISNPTAPLIVGAVGMRDLAVDVEIADGIAYVTDEFGGVHVVDISTPTQPVLVGGLNTPDVAYGVALDASHMYIACGDAGMAVAGLQCTAATDADPIVLGGPGMATLGGIAPNPFGARTAISFRITQPSRVSLAVFDTRGRVVRGILDRTLPAGTHSIDWDGKDVHGRTVSNGVYYVRLMSGDRMDVKRVARLR